MNIPKCFVFWLNFLNVVYISSAELYIILIFKKVGSAHGYTEYNLIM